MQRYTAHGGDDADVGCAPLGQHAQPVFTLFRFGVFEGNDPLHADLASQGFDLMLLQARVCSGVVAFLAFACRDKTNDLQAEFGLAFEGHGGIGSVVANANDDGGPNPEVHAFEQVPSRGPHAHQRQQNHAPRNAPPWQGHLPLVDGHKRHVQQRQQTDQA